MYWVPSGVAVGEGAAGLVTFFIKRAQVLGFSLEEIATLLELEDATDRRSIRRIAAARLKKTWRSIADLWHIERVLGHLLHECEMHEKVPHCPIIAAITDAGLEA